LYIPFIGEIVVVANSYLGVTSVNKLKVKLGCLTTDVLIEISRNIYPMDRNSIKGILLEVIFFVEYMGWEIYNGKPNKKDQKDQ
jgi:hypothetical protein